MFGSFTYGTFHLIGLTHLTFRLSPTVFAGRLPRHTLSPGFWSRGFRLASGTIRPSDDSQGTASHFACAYRVTSLGATRGSWEPSWGHAQIFRTVLSANTLVRWVNENAFAPIVRARPCPTFGRPVRPWGSPHRLRPGTSPHTLRIPPRDGHPVLRSTSSGGFRSILLVSSFRLRAPRDFSIPSSRFGQRGITPAFGYGAPHPSAGGTSTLLIWALPSAHYGPVRLPAAVQSAPVIPRWLPPPVTIPADAAGSPRFRHDPFARDVASDPGGAMAPRDGGATHVAFGSDDGLGLHNVVISWLNPTPHAITVYASDPALPRRPQHSLPGGSLRLTRTGLSPVGSRQLRLAHRAVTP